MTAILNVLDYLYFLNEFIRQRKKEEKWLTLNVNNKFIIFGGVKVEVILPSLPKTALTYVELCTENYATVKIKKKFFQNFNFSIEDFIFCPSHVCKSEMTTLFKLSINSLIREIC